MSCGKSVRVDEYGFRATSTKVETGKPGWLLLGDSVTFGIGVDADSTFAGLLQSETDALNVLNPSIIGYNVEDYLNLVEAFVVEKRHRLNIRRTTIFWCLNDVYTDIQDIQTPGGGLDIFFQTHCYI